MKILIEKCYKLFLTNYDTIYTTYSIYFGIVQKTFEIFSEWPIYRDCCWSENSCKSVFSAAIISLFNNYTSWSNLLPNVVWRVMKRSLYSSS